MKRNKGKELLFICLIFLLAGCGPQEEETTDSASESITVAFDESIPNVLQMTRKEIESLSLEEFKDSIKQYLPSYREYFKIPSDFVMTDSDWENIRFLLCENLFGPEMAEETKAPAAPELFASEAGVEVEDNPDWIYEAPSKTLLSDMTPDEFREYCIGYYEYLERDQFTEEELEENMKIVREKFLSMPEEEILEMKWDMVDALDQ